MLVVILGAGASYDFDPQRPAPIGVGGRPPLASELFDQRFGNVVDLYPQARALIGRLRKMGGSNTVEQELERVRDDATRYPYLPRQLTAVRFYLNTVIRDTVRNWSNQCQGITNQVLLVYDLERWRHDHDETVCFITFNYDLLVEEALDSVLGLKFPSMASYLSQPGYQLVKLHGSVDWFREVVKPDIERPPVGADYRGDDQILIEAGGQLQLGDSVLALGERNSPPHNSGLMMFHPAIAIPTVTKTVFECPQSHVDAALDAIRIAGRILVIGWRGLEAHFTRRWRQAGCNAPLLQIVDGGPEAASSAARNIEMSAGLGNARILHHAAQGFSKFIEQGGLSPLLRTQPVS